MLSIIQEACNKSKDRVANHCQVHIKFPDFSKLFHILCNWTFCDQTNLMQIICGYFSVPLCRVCKYRPITSPRVGFVCKMSSYHFDTLCDTFQPFVHFHRVYCTLCSCTTQAITHSMTRLIHQTFPGPLSNLEFFHVLCIIQVGGHPEKMTTRTQVSKVHKQCSTFTTISLETMQYYEIQFSF